MAYVTPTSKTTGDLIDASEWNQNTVDNPIALRTGGIAIASQAANDILYASSSTQLARLAAGTAGQVLSTQGAGSAPSWIDQSQGLRQTFRGLSLRTHPDSDVAAYKVFLNHADEIVMHDGTRVADWDDLTADITASGAGGLDTGSEGASRWYEIHAIRKSSDGTKNLLLHRAKSYDLDQSQTTTTAEGDLHYSSNQTKLAQGFTPGLTGIMPFVDLAVKKVASPTGYVTVAIYADSGGNPTGSALASSDAMDVSLFPTSYGWFRFPFRVPVSLTASTQYHLVMTSTSANDTTNYFNWGAIGSDAYAGGVAKRWDGSAWQTSSVAGFNAVDMAFKTYITQNDTAVTMPTGYDQRALIGWVYNNSSSNFFPMSARDRIVRAYNVAVSVGTATIPTLVDTSAGMHPPCPVWIVNATIRGSVVTARLTVGPDVGLSWDSSFNWDLLGADYFNNLAIDVPVEFQHVYYKITSGNAYFYPVSYQW
jgi:hypothetical protein